MDAVGMAIQDEYQGAALVPALSASLVKKPTSTRSCQLCHQRKIRCDKRSPCSNCVRGNVSCHYPGMERRPRRPHKTTITDVSSRVTKLELVVDALSRSRNTPGIAAPVSLNALSHTSGTGEGSLCGETTMDDETTDHTEREGSTEELLVQDGASSCYVNEVLLSRILDEERRLQSVMGNPKLDTVHASNNVESFDIGMPFSHFREPAPGEQIQPPNRRQAVQLWRAYIQNCDTLGKILHVPTMEAAVFGAVNNPNNIESDLSALLFSIYFAAITSLDSGDVSIVYGEEKGVLLCRFKEALEQYLAASKFLACPTMRSLQAMAIYLRCLRVYNLGRSSWTLFGLAIRSAQSIGLHRDGSNFKLSPFETEMRRRLWWYLCSIESRAAEDHGISVSDYTVSSSGTRLPSNLDDSDLYPSMTELPASKAMWTAMTFSLVVLETSLVVYQNLSSPISASSDKQFREQVLQTHLLHLEETYLKYCDPNIPIQRATILMGRFLSTKASFVTQQQEMKRLPDAARHPSAATEDSLIMACQMLEMNIQLQTEDILRDFRWIFVTYTQYHPLLYVLWHLCIKPTSPIADRAWATVLRVFEISSHRECATMRGSKWSMVHTLKRKACRRLREIADQQHTLAASGGKTESIETPTSDFDDNFNASFHPSGFLDIGTTDFADWSNLVDNFGIYDFDG